MEYHTAYFWQDSEGNQASLTLQQVYHKAKRLPVVFACMGWSEEEKLAAKAVEKLTDWFYAEGLSQCIRKGEKGIYKVGGRLYRQIKANNITASLVGILGMGAHLCIFYVGKASVRILNLQKGVGYSKDLQLTGRDKRGIGMQYASMEPGVGVLLGTDGFWQGVEGLCVEDCLNVKELDGKMRVEKRLREVGKLGKERGGDNMAAILLVSQCSET